MPKKCQNIFKVILFISLFMVIFSHLLKGFRVERNPINLFYEEPENSIDVVYYGASNVYSHFNSPLAYDKYGYTVWNMSADSQPLSVVKYLMDDVLKRQKPILHVIDIFKVCDNLSWYSDVSIRKSTDSMPFSKNKFKAINEALTYHDGNYLDYYFDFLLYHNMWKNENNQIFNSLYRSDLYRSFLLRPFATCIASGKKDDWDETIESLPRLNKKILIELLDYIKAKDLNVLFVIPPRVFETVQMRRLNDAVNIIEDNGFKVINFYTSTDLNIDFNKNFCDMIHLNIYGSTKFTLYFSKYLHDNYILPNHKKDLKYKIWQTEYERLKKDFKFAYEKDYEQIVLEYEKTNG